MKFKFKVSPNKSSYTILLADQDASNDQKIKHWHSLYQISPSVVDSKVPVEIFKMIDGGQVQKTAIIDINDKYDHQSLTKVFLDFAISNKAQLPAKIQIDLSFTDISRIVPAITHAFELATYDLSLYVTKNKEVHPWSESPVEITFIHPDKLGNQFKKSIRDIQTITKYQKEAMDLVNGPSNKVDAAHMVSWIKSKEKTSALKVNAFNKTKMEKTGLHAVLAVNQGSKTEPAFIIAQYQGAKDPDASTIGLVGKGVTFDTGGLSIKPSNNLHYMKSDMGGAAAVLATIAAIAELKWPVNLVAVAPVTDNCVDGTSIKPGDVINSYSGKTIEIIDTDAEGRLILADALSYLVQHFELSHVIDLATLTGSCVRTFGTACAGLFSNDEELADQLISAGMQTGEKVWMLPLWDEYAEEMKSDIADIKNLSTRPMAGAITAAKFLEAFILDHPSWAHLDIAGVAFGDTKFGKSKAATGWGVHLLCEFIKETGD